LAPGAAVGVLVGFLHGMKTQTIIDRKPASMK
jgi:hypothetical protein